MFGSPGNVSQLGHVPVEKTAIYIPLKCLTLQEDFMFISRFIPVTQYHKGFW